MGEICAVFWRFFTQKCLKWWFEWDCQCRTKNGALQVDDNQRPQDGQVDDDQRSQEEQVDDNQRPQEGQLDDDQRPQEDEHVERGTSRSYQPSH